ncbi:25176_t:CDS:2, partial [Gigaspora margarita]
IDLVVSERRNDQLQINSEVNNSEVIQEEGTNEIVKIPIENSRNLSTNFFRKYYYFEVFTLEMNKDPINFHELNEKINSTEDNNQKTNQYVIRYYYNFGKDIVYDASNALVNNKIREHIPDQDRITEANLRKRKERAKKIFRLFNSIDGEN